VAARSSSGETGFPRGDGRNHLEACVAELR